MKEENGVIIKSRPTVACKECKKQTTNNTFCSLICMALYKSRNIKRIKPCQMCRKKHKNKNFCSKKCRAEWNSKFNKYAPGNTRVCPSCQKNFQISGNKRIYCSNTCKKRIYKFNEDYFDELDVKGAKLLGMFFSCGYILSGDPNKILVRHKNREVIEYISTELNSTYPIKERPIYYEVRLSSKKFSHRLIDLGFRKNDFLFEFPELKSSLEPHFIEGLTQTTSTREWNNKKIYRVKSKNIYLHLRERGWKSHLTGTEIWVY